jgi:hypothetical protein
MRQNKLQLIFNNISQQNYQNHNFSTTLEIWLFLPKQNKSYFKKNLKTKWKL